VPKYRAEYSAAFTEDYLYWTRTDQAVASRIDRLMLAIEQNPFSGVGKPEPLRWGPFKAAWSRRITREHRLIYKVEKNTITFLQCRYHY
jgi:toxin YoeB